MGFLWQDIEGVDPSYFKTLSWMLENDITDILDLTFTEEVDYFGRMEIKELKPGGRDIKVTEGNKREYINLKAQHYMTTAIKAQLQAFLQGFWDLIPQARRGISTRKEECLTQRLCLKMRRNS